MSDLDVITRLRPEVELPTKADLAPARRQLTAAIDAELASSRPQAGETAIPQSPDIRGLVRRRNLALAGLAALAAAAVLFVVIPGRTSVPKPSAPVTELTTARFLNRAANAVVNDPATPPRPDQFVYSKTEGPDRTITETWLSADGSAEGLTRWTTISGGTGSNELGAPCSLQLAEASGCSPFVGYYPDLPTDPNAVLSYLNKVHIVDTADPPSEAGWTDNVIGKAAVQLMSSSYLLPAQQAAFFKLMAETPGFQVVSPMTDAIGRSGVGIEWTFEGATSALIFDPATYAYLGVRSWPAGQPADPHAPYDGDALVGLAVVASAGQQP